MGEVFKHGKTKKERAKNLAKELQISEEEAEKILRKRESEDNDEE